MPDSPFQLLSSTTACHGLNKTEKKTKNVTKGETSIDWSIDRSFIQSIDRLFNDQSLDRKEEKRKKKTRKKKKEIKTERKKEMGNRCLTRPLGIRNRHLSLSESKTIALKSNNCCCKIKTIVSLSQKTQCYGRNDHVRTPKVTKPVVLDSKTEMLDSERPFRTSKHAMRAPKWPFRYFDSILYCPWHNKPQFSNWHCASLSAGTFGCTSHFVQQDLQQGTAMP